MLEAVVWTVVHRMALFLSIITIVINEKDCGRIPVEIRYL